MPLVAFPYTLHQGYAMLMIPIMNLAHKIWAFVDSGAVFSRLRVDEAYHLSIDWASGRRQMIVVDNAVLFRPLYMISLSTDRKREAYAHHHD